MTTVRLLADGRYSDELLGFVVACVFNQAITMDEFRDWCASALTLEDAPPFLLDLAAFDGALFQVFGVIGHVPAWVHSEAEERALLGIALLRGFELFDLPVPESSIVHDSPEVGFIRRLFSRVFSEIELPE